MNLPDSLSLLVVYTFVAFTTNVIIDKIGFPHFITKGEKFKELRTIFSILWMLYYISLIIWAVYLAYKKLESMFVLKKGHRLYIANRIALYSLPVALFIAVVIIVVRNGGIK